MNLKQLFQAASKAAKINKEFQRQFKQSVSPKSQVVKGRYSNSTIKSCSGSH